MDNLEVLSLSRNVIKKLENLDAVSDTLTQLWLSYNNITYAPNATPFCSAFVSFYFPSQSHAAGLMDED